MPVLIICADPWVWQFAGLFRDLLSKPQFKYFVTVLLALLVREGNHTLRGLLRGVGSPISLSGLSRFFGVAPWDPEAVLKRQWKHFASQVQPQIEAERERLVPIKREELRQRLREKGRGRGGRLKPACVTAYLIGDDTTLPKRKGRVMEGVGVHYSSTERRKLRGHCMVLGVLSVVGRICPLAPKLYSQKSVCMKEGKPFRDKLELMIEIFKEYQPLPHTRTMVLLDSWYAAGKVFRAAIARGFGICCQLKSNRSLQIQEGGPVHGRSATGREWVKLPEYAARLKKEDYQRLLWPSKTNLGEKDASKKRFVWVHTISSRIKKLGRAQVVVVRESFAPKENPTAQGPDKKAEIHYFACSDLNADAATLIGYMAARWQIEVLFGDVKELLGLDHYQMMSATSIKRYWSLVLLAYSLLEEIRAGLVQQYLHPVTIGQARQILQRKHHIHLLDWIHQQFQKGVTPDHIRQYLLPGPLSTARAA